MKTSDLNLDNKLGDCSRSGVLLVILSLRETPVGGVRIFELG